MLARLRRVPTLESLFVATIALLGFRVGSLPLGDNSTFVHLRTGIDIVAGRGIPARDVYSFTAAGEPWVVQSWLPSVLYGAAHSLGSVAAVVVVNGLLAALLAWLVARLARAGTPLRTLAAAGVAVGAGISYWAPRPLLVGLVCLVLTITVVERRLPLWWLLPIGWVWANSHGSFVLGLAWLALRLVGERIDAQRTARVGTLLTFRALGALTGGVALGAAGPIGLRLLAFPFVAAGRRDLLAEVAEWQSPDFQDAIALTSLVFLAGALVVLLRARPSWADVVPVVAFVVGGLYAQRNLPAAAVVLAPALGRALAVERGAPSDANASDLTASDPAARPPAHRAVAALLVVLAVLFGVAPVAGDALDLRGYPVAALEWIDDEGLRRPPHRVAHTDVTGGLLILEHGRDADVFFDDRVDMYPRAIVRDYVTVLEGRPGALGVLDRHRIDVVLWHRRQPLVAVLSESADWRRVYRDARYTVYVRSATLLD